MNTLLGIWNWDIPQESHVRLWVLVTDASVLQAVVIWDWQTELALSVSEYFLCIVTNLSTGSFSSKLVLSYACMSIQLK